jgi:hypothetical protein
MTRWFCWYFASRRDTISWSTDEMSRNHVLKQELNHIEYAYPGQPPPSRLQPLGSMCDY